MNALMVAGILAGAVLLGWLVCLIGSIRCVVTVESTCAHCEETHASRGTLFGALRDQCDWEDQHMGRTWTPVAHPLAARESMVAEMSYKDAVVQVIDKSLDETDKWASDRDSGPSWATYKHPNGLTLELWHGLHDGFITDPERNTYNLTLEQCVKAKAIAEYQKELKYKAALEKLTNPTPEPKEQKSHKGWWRK